MVKTHKVVQRILNVGLVQVFDLWRDKTSTEKKMKVRAMKVIVTVGEHNDYRAKYES